MCAPVIGAIIAIVAEVGAAVGAGVMAVGSAIATGVTALAGAVATIGTVVGQGLVALGQFVSGALTMIGEGISFIGSAIGEGLSVVGEMLAEGYAAAMEGIVGSEAAMTADVIVESSAVMGVEGGAALEGITLTAADIAIPEVVAFETTAFEAGISLAAPAAPAFEGAITTGVSLAEASTVVQGITAGKLVTGIVKAGETLSAITGIVGLFTDSPDYGKEWSAKDHDRSLRLERGWLYKRWQTEGHRESPLAGPAIDDVPVEAKQESAPTGLVVGGGGLAYA